MSDSFAPELCTRLLLDGYKLHRHTSWALRGELDLFPHNLVRTNITSKRFTDFVVLPERIIRLRGD